MADLTQKLQTLIKGSPSAESVAVAEAPASDAQAEVLPVPMADEPASPPPAQEPGKNPAAPGRFPVGAKVRSKDPKRSPGTVEGAPMPETESYVVRVSESETYIEAGSQLEPDAATADVPTTDAPPSAGSWWEVNRLLGLRADATEADAVSALKVLIEDRDGAIGTPDAALDRAGVKASLRPLVVGAMTRKTGETWDGAAERARSAFPDAFEFAQSPSASTDTPAASEPGRQAPVERTRAQIGEARQKATMLTRAVRPVPPPSGVSLPDVSGAAGPLSGFEAQQEANQARAAARRI